MPKLNLNNPIDFARLTQSTGAGILQQLTGLGGENWDIDEASYGHAGSAQVLFHVFKSSVDFDAAVSQVQDNGGRRKVQFAFPYIDGQSTDDLGRKGEAFDIDILIHGKNYRRAYDNLIREFNDPRPGTLNHPVRGGLPVAVLEWTVTHEEKSRNAVALRVRFIEHTFDVSFQRAESKPSTVKQALASAIAFFAKIDNVLTKIQSNIFVAQNFKSIATSSVQGYKDSYTDNLVRLNRTFNSSDTDDIPALLPTASGETQTEFEVAISPNDPFAGVPIGEIESSTITAFAAQQAVDSLKVLRETLNETLDVLSSANGGQGQLLFYEESLDLKRSSVSIQEVLEIGLQSSNARVISYETPRDMSLREICFANGLDVDRAFELEILNSSMLSTNHLPKGTQLKVPVS